MNIYEKEYKILSSDADINRRLRLSRLFTFIQEAAISHTQQLGVGREKKLDRGYLWVVSLQYAEIERLPEYAEKIFLKSWAGKTMHVMFPRFCEIADESGDVIIRASALWMLMDINTRKMIFPSEKGIFINGEDYTAGIILPKPIKAEDVTVKKDFHVNYSASDLNGHLTNTKYFDIAQDNFSAEKNKKTPKRIGIEYKNEARFGDSFTLGINETENSAFVTGIKDNGKTLFRLKTEY